VTQANIAHDGGDNNGFDPGNGFREEYARIWGKMQAKAPNGAAPARLRRTGPGLFLLIFKFTFQIQSVAKFPPGFGARCGQEIAPGSGTFGFCRNAPAVRPQASFRAQSGEQSVGHGPWSSAICPESSALLAEIATNGTFGD